MSKPKVVFFGTPEFAFPSLRELLRNDSFDVSAIVTQPDRPAGRGLQLAAPPVKEYLTPCILPLFQPSSIKKIEVKNDQLVGDERCKDLVEHLNETRPDAFVVVAYGKFIPDSLLTFPRCGVINLHPSLLPRWRGPAPIHWPLFQGESETGVTIMAVDSGMDSGPIYSQETLPILPSDTLGSLHDKLAETGGRLLVSTVRQILSGALTPIPQDERRATYAQKWGREQTLIRWEEPAQVTQRRVRASNPVPGARTTFKATEVKVFSTEIADSRKHRAADPGVVVEVNPAELVVAAGNGEVLAIKEMQFPGKKRLPIADILRGYQFKPGERFV